MNTEELLDGTTVWSSAVRLTTGDIIAFDKIFLTKNGTYLSGTFSYDGSPVGGITGGSSQGDHLAFRFKQIFTSNPLGDNRRPQVIEYDGQIRYNKAAGIVKFTDEFGINFDGTFILVPYQYNVPVPIPVAHKNSRDSAIEGSWKGEFFSRGYPNSYKYQLTLNLNQQSTAIFVTAKVNDGQANIVGTGTIGSQPPVNVRGTIVGSSYNLLVGDLNTGIEISGQVDQNFMIGQARLHTGQEYLNPGFPYPFLPGNVKLTR